MTREEDEEQSQGVAGEGLTPYVFLTLEELQNLRETIKKSLRELDLDREQIREKGDKLEQWVNIKLYWGNLEDGGSYGDSSYNNIFSESTSGRRRNLGLL